MFVFGFCSWCLFLSRFGRVVCVRRPARHDMLSACAAPRNLVEATRSSLTPPPPRSLITSAPGLINRQL